MRHVTLDPGILLFKAQATARSLHEVAGHMIRTTCVGLGNRPNSLFCECLLPSVAHLKVINTTCVCI